ncbi:MAG: hypothetical protein HOP19_16670, partial [Acidobacteria bacterium]|nr:hypothetical protein [Acidobacteriota bacterium]
MHADIILIRAVFILILIIAGYLIHPIPANVAEAIGWRGESGSKILSTIFAALIAAGIIYFELRIRRASLKTLIGAAIGSTMGILGASLMGFLITAQPWDQPIKSFLTLTLSLFMAYCGLLVGAAKGDYLDLSVLGGIL